MNNGNHWDVSDGDIVLQDVQSTIQETTVEGGDDHDELEFGPPNTLGQSQCPNDKELSLNIDRPAL